VYLALDDTVLDDDDEDLKNQFRDEDGKQNR
jgi:hypothetical protein